MEQNEYLIKQEQITALKEIANGLLKQRDNFFEAREEYFSDVFLQQVEPIDKNLLACIDAIKTLDVKKSTGKGGTIMG